MVMKSPLLLLETVGAAPAMEYCREVDDIGSTFGPHPCAPPHPTYTVRTYTVRTYARTYRAPVIF
jgi:hypothetical protein